MPGPMTDRVYSVATKKSGTLETTLHPIETPDGVKVSLSHLENRGAADAALLIHGLTTSSDMFVMPEHYNLAAYLHDHGFDVWLADFRMSNHYPYNQGSRFSFDDVALYDWPAIVGYIQERLDGRGLHVLAHCLGSVTFHLALYGQTISGISSVVSNSVSLNPRTHAWSAMKILFAPFLVEKVLRLPYVDPRWTEFDNKSKPWLGRLVARFMSLVHLECNDATCNLVSFMWGSGFPAVFVHETMDRITHDRLVDLFGAVSMEYFRNVRKGILSNNTFVPYKSGGAYDSLPRRFIDNVGTVQVPTLLLSGDRNNIFPGANKLTADRIRATGVTGYKYREIPGYGHQDVFMGKHCDRDVFPLCVDFLRPQPAS